MLLGRQTCCFCHGVECDGKPDPFAISLPDFDVSTVFSLLDVLYTGRAYFATRLVPQMQVALVIRGLFICELAYSQIKNRLNYNFQSKMAFLPAKSRFAVKGSYVTKMRLIKL